jgi:hypothetical protein
LKVLDLAGQTKGFVTIIERSDNKDGRSMWKAFCSRDNKYFEVLGKSFKSGLVRSCGCIKTEMNREKARIMSENNKLPPGEAALNLLYATYRWHAEVDRDFKFELTRDEFRALTKGDCYYCGMPPNQRFGYKLNGLYIYNGVDRYDNSKGYSADNCVSCCGPCNKAKGRRTAEAFIASSMAVAEKQKERAEVSLRLSLPRLIVG